MIKRIIKAPEGKIVQFKYIDGIDGPKTRAYAESLGLCTNGSISKIWEVRLADGWHIVDEFDYLVIKESQVA
jgi:hypothetical protein